MIVFFWIIAGLIAGWLAGEVMRGEGNGLIGDFIVGVIGGLLGGWLAYSVLHIGADVNEFNLESILFAFVGAIFLLIVLRVFSGGGRRILQLLNQKAYIDQHGEDVPEIRNWKWDIKSNETLP